MKLVIAEKPSVAGDISKVLGANKKMDGYYEGNNYIVSWCLGHLITLSMPESYEEKYKSWNINDLPIIPEKFKTETIKSTSKQYNTLKFLMNRNDVEEIICGTDAGREGELIFRLVYYKSKCSKPFKRLWISSLTEEAIKEGFSNLKPGESYDNLYRSSFCRAQADWIVGLNSTRLYTSKYRKKLTAGRVQTPTLNLIVNRNNEIINFVPKDYFQILGKFDGLNALWHDNEGNNKIDLIEDANKIVSKLGNFGIIESIKKKKKNTERPFLFDLTELQRAANRKYGYTSQDTLSIAQKLYETHKIITYPRTDSRFLTSDMKDKLAPLVKSIGENKSLRFKSEAENLLNAGLNIDKRVIDNKKVTDHHAIIVTPKINSYDTSKLNTKEKNILELIIIRILVTLSEKEQYEETEIIINVNDEIFKTKGKKILVGGWKELEQKLLGKADDKEKDDEGEIKISLRKGQEINLVETEILKKKTSPKNQYTEATLLSAMENVGSLVEEDLKEYIKEKGLGTPATRASIIEKLISTGYIVRKSKKLEPTEAGINLINVVPEKLKSPSLTAEWEERLLSIEKGKDNSVDFMKDIKKFINDIVIEEKSTGLKNVSFYDNSGKSNKEVIGICPKCKRRIFESEKSFYCEGYRYEDKCNFSIWKEDKFFKGFNIIVNSEMVKEFLNSGKYIMNELKIGEKIYKGFFSMNTEGKYVSFKFNFSK